MHIKKLKVRKGRGACSLPCYFSTVLTRNAHEAAYQTPCAAETLTMLSCWAANKDITNVGECATAAKTLSECMRTSVSFMFSRRNLPTHAYHCAPFSSRIAFRGEDPSYDVGCVDNWS